MTIRFPDLSHYEAGVPLNDVPALLTKATQGTTFVDPTYAGYRDAARALGIPFGGYHYVTLDDPGAQARHAFVVIGHDVPAMWDIEKGSGTLAHLLAVHDAYTALGGRATLAYVPHWYWQQIGSPDLRPLAARGLALISSAYTTYADTGPGWAPYGGATPLIWQYTNAGPLNGRAVDMNAFRGPLSELRKVFEGGTTAGDTGVSTMDEQSIAAAVWAHRLDNAGGPPTDPTAPVNAGVMVRASYFRDGQVANVDDPALKAALAALAAEVAALPGAQPGAGLTHDEIVSAMLDAFASGRVVLAVAPAAPAG